MSLQTESSRPWVNKVLAVMSAGMSLHILLSTQYNFLSHIPNLNLHLAFALTVVFLIYLERSRHAFFILLGCIVLSILVTGYIHWFEQALMDREGAPTPLDTVVGICIILLVMVASVLSFGWLMPSLATFALFYAYFGPYFPEMLFHGGIHPLKIVSMLTTGLQGIYGTLLFVSVTYIAIFLVFGAFLERSGAVRFFIDLPLSLARGVKAGGAYAAVFSSALMGMGSGSPTANVLTTGAFTIPLMKKSGFRSYVAGGIEAVASLGGQLMPPVMGAVAFVMAESLGKPYVYILGYAALPAFFYYVILAFNVFFRSGKMELSAPSEAELPDTMDVIRRNWKFILPIPVLVLILVIGYTPGLAAFWAILSVLAVSLPGWRMATPLLVLISPLFFLFPGNWFVWMLLAVGIAIWPGRCNRDFIRFIGDGLRVGGKNAAEFAIILSCLAIVVKVITATGVALRLPMLVGIYSEGNIVLGYIITAFACMILGLGLPTVAAYIVVSVLAVPILRDMGATELQAHFFVLYFSVLSGITPPVAMASLAGSRVANAPYIPTCLASLRFGASGYALPFFFAFNPALLGIGSLQDILLGCMMAGASMIALSAALQAYFVKSTNFLQQGLLFAATAGFAGGVIGGGYIWVSVGLATFLTVLLWQLAEVKREKNLGN